MKIQDILNTGINKLKNKSTSPALDAEVLLAYALNKPKEHLYIHANHELRLRKRVRNYLGLIEKRAQGWPVAYLTGQKEFYGLKFFVDKNVLTPRPETECLVELVLQKLKIVNCKLRILDVGTGSGCIIISLTKALSTLAPHPSTLFSASDISKAALKVAQKNANLHKVKIAFKHGSLLKPWEGKNFDIIVANLPYLAKQTDPSTKFEPRRALIAKKQGLALIENLIRQIRSYSLIRPFADSIFLEFDPRQAKQIKKLAKKYLPKFETKIFKDLAGKQRFACLSLKLS
ncbi:MAG: peptide chain release factor N(5)-glutamine methyltransferase [Candidatus Doudnabacteria bacterium]|nr:peptide chain release factor N(5)-glutamine methyltransferase [Candidatus Doudnabacteria bacterium]